MRGNFLFNPSLIIKKLAFARAKKDVSQLKRPLENSHIKKCKQKTAMHLSPSEKLKSLLKATAYSCIAYCMM